MAPPAMETSFPRIRGDVPSKTCLDRGQLKFSPHTRGCSGKTKAEIIAAAVFPAYAGMFLIVIRFAFFRGGFPRIRGDVPTSNR